MTLKERIEQDLTIFLLGSLLTGFLSGFAAYRAIQQVGGSTPISKIRLDALQQNLSASQKEASQSKEEIVQLRRAMSEASPKGSPSDKSTRLTYLTKFHGTVTADEDCKKAARSAGAAHAGIEENMGNDWISFKFVRSEVSVVCTSDRGMVIGASSATDLPETQDLVKAIYTDVFGT